MIKMKKNKGEMTIGTLITLIVLLIGFAILLFFLYQMFFQQRVDKEACHQSIIFRATLPAFGGIQSAVNLKCRTEKICITSGFIGGNCKEFEGSKGVTKVKVSNKEQIERTIAQSISECWTMTGEGKVDLFSQWIAKDYGFGSVYPSCIICTRIAFDMEGLAKAGIDPKVLATTNIDKYMMTHAVPNKEISYYEYLFGKSPMKSSVQNNLLGLQGAVPSPSPEIVVSDCNSYCLSNGYSSGRLFAEGAPCEITETKKEVEESYGTNKCCCTPSFEGASIGLGDPKLTDDITGFNNEGNLDLQAKELAIMFMQISAPSHGESAANIGKLVMGAATGSMVSAPVTTVNSLKSVGKLCTSNGYAAAACAGVLILAGVYQQGSVAYNRAVTAGYCSDVLDKDKAREGCSVVRTVNYNAADIAQSCGVIESIS